jgi:ferredoxin
MRIRVDTERCTGHALCAAYAPDVFVLDDLGYNRTELVEVAPEFREQARRGAMACPEQAITVVDDRTPDDA